MNIKNVKPDDKYWHRNFQPTNANKYKGLYPIVCRSSWEYKYCIYCDTEPSILEWSSEPFKIKYYYPITEKYRHYFPDYWIKVMTVSGNIREYLVEIKPKKYLKKPIPPKVKTAKKVKNYKYLVETYVEITAKAIAAKKFAKMNNMEYIILTEDTLK